MNPIAALRRYFANIERSRQLLEEIREGVANLTDVTNRHLIKLVEIMELAVEETKLAEARDGASARDQQKNIPGGSAPPRARFPAEVGDH